MDSILTSTKKLLGITEEDISFDADIIMHINSVFAILTQMGVGPDEGFYIEDKQDIWNDFIDDNLKLISVKSYMYLKVKLLFDPPASSALTEAMNRSISEFEFRLGTAAGENQNGS